MRHSLSSSTQYRHYRPPFGSSFVSSIDSADLDGHEPPSPEWSHLAGVRGHHHTPRLTPHLTTADPFDGFMDSKVRSVDDYWAKMQARAQPTPEAVKIVHKRKAKRGGKNIVKGVKEVLDAVGGMVDVQKWRLKKVGKRAEVAARRAKMKVKNAGGRRESHVSY